MAWVALLASAAPEHASLSERDAGASTSATPPPPHLQYMTYYGCEPATQAGHTNLCITHNSSLLIDAHAAQMAGMLQVTWAFFRNAVPPRTGLQLREDYKDGWDAAWSGSSWSSGCDGVWSARPCVPLRNLSVSGVAMGVFLGDELLGAGVNVTELTMAAESVKASWPTGVVYWNEEWGPVVDNSTWTPSSSALHVVPVSVRVRVRVSVSVCERVCVAAHARCAATLTPRAQASRATIHVSSPLKR
jgi:hypothetical protein